MLPTHSGHVAVTGGRGARGEHDATAREQPHDMGPPFIARLRKAIGMSQCRDAIQWLDDGITLAIHEENFRACALGGVLFRTTKMASFVRNLNKHGFRKVTLHTTADEDGISDTDWAFYRHINFVRNDPGRKMQCRIVLPLRARGGRLSPFVSHHQRHHDKFDDAASSDDDERRAEAVLPLDNHDSDAEDDDAPHKHKHARRRTQQQRDSDQGSNNGSNDRQSAKASHTGPDHDHAMPPPLMPIADVVTMTAGGPDTQASPQTAFADHNIVWAAPTRGQHQAAPPAAHTSSSNAYQAKRSARDTASLLLVDASDEQLADECARRLAHRMPLQQAGPRQAAAHKALQGHEQMLRGGAVSVTSALPDLGLASGYTPNSSTAMRNVAASLHEVPVLSAAQPFASYMPLLPFPSMAWGQQGFSGTSKGEARDDRAATPFFPTTSSVPHMGLSMYAPSLMPFATMPGMFMTRDQQGQALSAFNMQPSSRSAAVVDIAPAAGTRPSARRDRHEGLGSLGEPQTCSCARGMLDVTLMMSLILTVTCFSTGVVLRFSFSCL